ncbi:hypothetical protein BLNAU_14592 [Blattamonas nauphoetae]|uniref:Uncharacterized protein n=1 Tax=Blattamonas nauphoetae TaxID=2049346 RepID=A0ABQ9XGC8_9EUKA|nr:hypothetical protein BLNAU_14592 [Blattamonas nauphoetae]
MIKIEVLVIGIISTDCSQFSHSSFQNLHASEDLNLNSLDAWCLPKVNASDRLTHITVSTDAPGFKARFSLNSVSTYSFLLKIFKNCNRT